METCNTCGYCDKNKQICLFYNIQVNIDKDFCSKHIAEPIRCEICQSLMTTKGSFLEQDNEDNWHMYCGRCKTLLSTCQTCKKVAVCPFETDPNPMPKVVMKTVQNGNMIMQTQVRNEERIKLFCLSCDCWDSEENQCRKELNIECNKKIGNWNSRNPL